MDCRTCKFAKWDTTKNGRRHPSGDGRCTCPIKMPTLPKAFYWMSMSDPTPSGGYINYREKTGEGCQRWMSKE